MMLAPKCISFLILGARLVFGQQNTFCIYQCKDSSYPNSCVSGTCPAPASGCTALDHYTFGSEGACSAFRDSEPDCTTGGCVGANSFETVYLKEKQLCQFYNQKVFQGVQALYLPSAVVVTPEADSFVPASDVANFFKFYEEQGVTQLSLTPYRTLKTTDNTVIHEIGHGMHLNDKVTKTAPYYVRWVQNMYDWKLESEVTAMGPSRFESHLALPQKAARLGAPNATAIIAERAAELSKLFNAGDYVGMFALYADAAVLLPPTAADFVQGNLTSPGGGIPGFWEFANKGGGIQGLSLTPYRVQLSADELVIHEIGRANAKPVWNDKPYFRRWVNDKGSWKVETDIVEIGNPLGTGKGAWQKVIV